jgi:transcriptional regulator GlxA family with amidase domain
MADRDVPLRVAIVVAPRVSVLTFVLAYEPFHAANRLSLRPPFDIKVLKVHDHELVASSGMPIAHDGLIDNQQQFDLIIVIASFEQSDLYKRQLNSWLRRQARYGAVLCALDHAVWFFAEAGLFGDTTVVSVNRELLSSMQERFPTLDARATLYSIDRDRMTCGGHMATLDLFLEYILRNCGQMLAQVLMSEMLASTIRIGDTPQTDSLSTGHWKLHPSLRRALDVMTKHTELPLPLQDIARHAGISLRQLEQLARSANAPTPSRQYLELRIGKARETLIYTELSMSEIALATGFASLSAFSRAFKARFRTAPTTYRKEFRTRMVRPYMK